jgi:hypothetical protein
MEVALIMAVALSRAMCRRVSAERRGGSAAPADRGQSARHLQPEWSGAERPGCPRCGITGLIFVDRTKVRSPRSERWWPTGVQDRLFACVLEKNPGKAWGSTITILTTRPWIGRRIDCFPSRIQLLIIRDAAAALDLTGFMRTRWPFGRQLPFWLSAIQVAPKSGTTRALIRHCDGARQAAGVLRPSFKH